MRISSGPLAIAVMLSLLIVCSGCGTTQHAGAVIPAGPSAARSNGPNTIPPGPSVVPSGAKH